MIFADVLKIFLLVAGGMLVLVTHWLLAQALFPGRVARLSRLYSRWGRALALGLVIVLPPVVAGGLLFQRGGGPTKALGFLLVALPVALGLFGSAGLARRVGDGLAAPDEPENPGRRVWRGGWVLVSCALFPFLGWFVWLPLLLVTGAGAALLALRRPPEAA